MKQRDVTMLMRLFFCFVAILLLRVCYAATDVSVDDEIVKQATEFGLREVNMDLFKKYGSTGLSIELGSKYTSRWLSLDHIESAQVYSDSEGDLYFIKIVVVNTFNNLQTTIDVLNEVGKDTALNRYAEWKRAVYGKKKAADIDKDNEELKKRNLIGFLMCVDPHEMRRQFSEKGLPGEVPTRFKLEVFRDKDGKFELLEYARLKKKPEAPTAETPKAEL